MADHLADAQTIFIEDDLMRLFSLIQETKVDVHYLNWLCDIYHSAPQFLKYALLAILQMFSGRSGLCQLKKRVKMMLMSYPLNPEKLNLEVTQEDCINSVELSKRCINLSKTMTMSRSLMDRLSQHSIHHQLHHQPVAIALSSLKNSCPGKLHS